MTANPNSPSPPDAVWQRPTLYPKQAAFVDCPARCTIVEASCKSGKTVACLVWLFEKAIRGQRGQNFWWVAPIYAQATIAYTRLKNWLRESGLPPAGYSCHDSGQRITLGNGAVIWFKGSDNEDGLYGEDVFACVIDEASRCSQGAWHAIRTTLTATRGPLKIIGNVLEANYGQTWMARLAKQARAGLPDTAYFKLTAVDAVQAGILDQDEIDNAKQMLPEHVFQALYMAEASEDYSAQLIQDGWIEQAQNRLLRPRQSHKLIACDPARFGDDETVCYVMQDTQIVGEMIYGQHDLMYTANKLFVTRRETGAELVAVDATGLGSGVADRLVEMGCPVLEFESAGKAGEPDRFYNLRAEAWYLAREMFQLGDVQLHAPWPDALLRGQLTVPSYNYRSGRIIVEDKAEIKKRLGRSPDRADAYVMGLAGLRYLRGEGFVNSPGVRRREPAKVSQWIDPPMFSVAWFDEQEKLAAVKKGKW